MDDQKLQQLIQELESYENKEDAYFGIQQYGGGTDESFVQGNKEGLIRFAKELLFASIKTEETDGKIIHFFRDHEWIDDMSEVGIEYIEKVKTAKKIVKSEDNFTGNRLIGIGCFILLLGIIALIIIGVVTVFNWL